MTDEKTDIIEAHQDLVGHIEKSASGLRLLSGVTIAVALFLSVSYAYQLLLPALGTTSVTVNLTDPTNEATEVVVLLLALVWLYVGARDLLFASRMSKDIRAARFKEREIEGRISGQASEGS